MKWIVKELKKNKYWKWFFCKYSSSLNASCSFCKISRNIRPLSHSSCGRSNCERRTGKGHEEKVCVHVCMCVCVWEYLSVYLGKGGNWEGKGSRRNTPGSTSLDCYALCLDSLGRLNNIQLAQRRKNRETCGNWRSRKTPKGKTDSKAWTDQQTVKLEWEV